MKKSILKNGLTLITDKYPGDAIAIVLGVKVGAICEDQKNAGISHFVEHMMFTGTKNKTKEQIDEEIEENGFRLGGSTGLTNTNYYLDFLSRYFDKFLNIMVDIMQNPLFDEKAIEIQKGIISREIGLSKDNIYCSLGELFRKTLFKKDPIRNIGLGTIKNVESFTKKDLIKHHKKYYVPNNMIICVVGDIGHAEIKKKIEKAFLNFKKGKLPKLRKIKESKQTKPQIKIEEREVKATYIDIGYKIPINEEKNSAIFNVIKSILFKRLEKKNDEKFFARHITIESGVGKDTGFFLIGTTTDSVKEKLAKKIILEDLKLKDITNEEIKTAKIDTAGKYFLGKEGRLFWAKKLVEFEAIKDFKFGEEYLKAIKKVTKKDIKRFVKKYFNENYTMIIIKSKNKKTK